MSIKQTYMQYKKYISVEQTIFSISLENQRISA